MHSIVMKMKDSKFMQQTIQPGKEDNSIDMRLTKLFAAAGQAIDEVPIPVNFGTAANDIVVYMLRNRDQFSEQQDMSAMLLAWYCICKDEAGKEVSTDAI